MSTLNRPPWLTPDELSSARAWCSDQMHALKLVPAGKPAIVKAGSISIVWRQLATSGGEVFFKVVPPLFAQEPALTARLSQHRPENTPHVLAIDQDLRCMLTRTVHGVDLEQTPSVDQWMATVRVLARIHIESIDRVDEFTACGCPTRAVASLPEELGPVLSEATARCASHGHPVNEDTLRTVRGMQSSLNDWAAKLAESPVPPTLVHGDFHAGNVIISQESAEPVILDWTDGAIAHPFLDLLIFLRGRAIDRMTAHRQTIVDAYLSEWEAAGYGTADQLGKLFLTAQCLAPLYHAASYHRVFGICDAAAAQFADALPWLLAMLAEAETVADTP